MIEQITLKDILAQLYGYLAGDSTYDSLRSFVYHRYESENEVVVDDRGDELLSVLAPYIETETAIPDRDRSIRLRRLGETLRATGGQRMAEVAVFSLNFHEIGCLRQKRDDEVITDLVYEEQIGKLSPARFDVECVSNWARLHANEDSPNVNLMQ
jgi:hypothetical protein